VEPDGGITQGLRGDGARVPLIQSGSSTKKVKVDGS
jgi:hypothetical protein